MKNSIFFFAAIAATVSFSSSSNAQSEPVQSVAVLRIESLNYLLNSEEITKVAIYELRKMGDFNVPDQVQMANMLKGQKVNSTHCNTRACAEKAGKAMGVSKVIVGSVEFFEGRLVVVLQMFDTGGLEEPRTSLSEFGELQVDNLNMMHIALSKLMQREYSPEAMTNLKATHPVQKLDISQGAPRLSLSGPRMGMTYLHGTSAEFITRAKSEGGHDAMPFMFQVGYQFEKQYLNEGNFQALVEVIPSVTGLDQGLAIPGLTVLHGLRSNKSGWEFAFGPTLTVTQKAEGYYDENGTWNLSKTWDTELMGENPNPTLIRLDSRGDYKLSSSFLIAAGKSFRSGRVNIPVNAYFVPNKDGWRAGVSFGFNSKKGRK